MGQRVLSRISIPSLSSTVDPASFHFVHEYIGTGTPGSVDWGDLATAGANFINNTGTGGVTSISNYLSDSCDRGTNHCSVTLYDITGHEDGTPHGSPILISQFTLGGSVGVGVMPEGVCAVVSYRSDYGTAVEFGPTSAIPTPPDIIADYSAAATHQGKTRPRSRLRNRFYLGPLSPAAMSNEATTHRTILGAQFQTDVLAALFDYADISEAGVPTWALRTWSRRNASVVLVTEAWMDDRPDYQRRRSDPSALKTFKAMPSA